MAVRGRANTLALAVLVCLYEGPMHPYEIATTLRQRSKHESVRLNYGSLYAVVESLERRGLIEAQGTERSGHLPERTIYRLTEAGRTEMTDWLDELISMPVKEYPAFEAALSFLPALAPGTVVGLLHERADRLKMAIAAMQAIRGLVKEHGLPRLVWVEAEFALVMKGAELAYVESLAGDIDNGTLEGVEWWHEVHEAGPGAAPPLPFIDPSRRLAGLDGEQTPHMKGRTRQ